MIQFEDIHPDFDPAGYLTTNEEPMVHRDLLKGYRIRKAASICSGGEVPLLVLLPRCQQVFAVDHSYKALACTYAKATLLTKLGADKMKELFVGGTLAISIKALTDHVRPEDAPEPLRKYLDPGVIKGKYISHGLGLTFTNGTYTDIRREMHYTPLSMLRLAAKHIDRLRLIHGDLTDLAKYGPFNLLYASNAREHFNRNSKNPTWPEISSLVKDNGLLLDTCYPGSPRLKKPTENGWKLLKSTVGYRTSWSHNLYQKVDEVAKPEVESAI